jgi:hypothetical protein
MIRHMIYTGDKSVDNYFYYYKESAQLAIDSIGHKTARVVKVRVEIIDEEEENPKKEWYSQSTSEQELQATS